MSARSALRPARPSPRRTLPLVGLGLGALSALVGCVGSHPYAGAIERAEVAYTLGQPEDAADAYRTALEYEPEDPVALHGLARCEVARGQPERALETLSLLEQVAPGSLAGRARADYTAALRGAGAERLARGDSAAGLRYLRRLQAWAPEDPELADLLAAALVAEGGRLRVAGHGEEAEELFREALGRSPEPSDPAAQGLAQVLVARGRPDLAISVLSDALLRHPEDAGLRALMDRVLRIRYPDPLRLE